jgi:hypothetical protein
VNAGTRFVGPVQIFRRNWALLGFTVAVGIVGALLVMPWAPRSVGPWGGFMLFWGGLISPLVLARNPFPRREDHTLEADAEGLWLDGKIALSRGAILQAYVQPDGDAFGAGRGAVVRLRARGNAGFTFATARDAAPAILAALGLDTRSRTAAFSGRSPIRLARIGPFPAFAIVFALVLVGAVVLTAFGSALALPLTLLALALFTALAWVPSRVDVGADGVLRSWIGSRLFVPYREVARVEPFGGDVAVQRLDGTRIILGARKRYDPEAGQGADDAALLLRIQEAFGLHRLESSSGDAAAMLARGGRSVGEWVSQVRAMWATQGTSYRASALSEERLLRVVADPSAAPSMRAGAAVALAQGQNEAWRGDLQRAAHACADPRVRVVLETMATSQRDEDWVGALEELADDEPAKARSATRS